jgi:glycosyltransferase involved in cell wall biosynthesis
MSAQLSQGTGRKVLIIVENLPVPFDRRVWAEAVTLRDAGYAVSVISPKGRGYQASEETLQGIRVYRHPLPVEARGTVAYLAEYATALFWQLRISFRIARRDGFDVMHACNPPDIIFLVALPFKLFARKGFIFDHHDLNPELYEAKFGRRDLFWKLLVFAEKCTFRLADISIATNESYRRIACERGGMSKERVFVVRSGPDIRRVRNLPSDPKWRNARDYMVGYVGVIGQTEGLDLLLSAVDHIVNRRQRSDIQFVIVGDGPELPAIRKLCNEMELNDFCTFTGRTDDQELFTILSTADICVNPDRVTPMTDLSTMNKIMEYMAVGKPIVQFDVTEGKVSAQDASLYAQANDPVDFAERILELIDDPMRRNMMGSFGRRRVNEQLAWKYEQPKLLAAYETFFKSHFGQSN